MWRYPIIRQWFFKNNIFCELQTKKPKEGWAKTPNPPKYFIEKKMGEGHQFRFHDYIPLSLREACNEM